jgi:predicted O-methyltransferase YrrM
MAEQLALPKLYTQIPSEYTYAYLIYEEAVRTAPPGSMLIEVGTFWGRGAVYLAELAKAANKDLKVYCVDIWSHNAQTDPAIFNGDTWEAKGHRQHGNNLFKTFAHYIEETGLSPDPLRILRMDALEAAQFFNAMGWHQKLSMRGNTGIHMVFLDDNHDQSHLMDEISIWRKVILPGGILAGDDYTDEFPGVKAAVDQLFPEREIVNNHCWMVRATDNNNE